MDGSPLLRLPRELRDCIYEYALFQPRGILCRTSADGVARLYRREEARRSKRSIFAGAFRRLRIRTAPSERPHGPENNQLKYVCRCLYTETRGMDLRWNTVVVTDSGFSNAAQQGALLVARCLQLNRLSIVCSAESFAEEYGKLNFATLMRHCSARRNLSVRVRVPYWSLEKSNFVLLGLSLLSTLRGDSSLIARLAQTTSVSYLSDSVSELLTTVDPIPPNFRFFPREEEFDVDLFERSCPEGFLIHLPSTRDATGKPWGLIETWFTDGL